MSRAIDILCGLNESTTTASVGAVVTPPLGVVTPAGATKKSRMASLLARRKLRQEDEAESSMKAAIPTDAEVDTVTDPQAKGASTSRGDIEPPLPTSLALVAPDTTPGAEDPLDPSQVPQPPASMEVPSMSSPTPVNNGDDVMRTLLGDHQSKFNPSLISSPQGAAEAVAKLVTGDTLQEAATDTVVGAKAEAAAQSVLNAAHSGQAPAPHHNPNSMNQVIAVTRQLIG